MEYGPLHTDRTVRRHDKWSIQKKKNSNLEDLGCNTMNAKQVIRRGRVVKLMCMGKSGQEIADILGVSIRTVQRDLKSIEVQEIVEELKRRQLLDIEESEDERTRLQYRDKLLDKLIPKKVNTKIEGGRRPIILEIWQPKEK